MATYAELAALPNDSGWGAFIDKISTACFVKATAVIDATSPPQTALDWAKETLTDRYAAANAVVWYVVGANKSLSTATILAAGDGSVQTNVDDAIDAIYGS